MAWKCTSCGFENRDDHNLRCFCGNDPTIENAQNLNNELINNDNDNVYNLKKSLKEFAVGFSLGLQKLKQIFSAPRGASHLISITLLWLSRIFGAFIAASTSIAIITKIDLGYRGLLVLIVSFFCMSAFNIVGLISTLFMDKNNKYKKSFLLNHIFTTPSVYLILAIIIN